MSRAFVEEDHTIKVAGLFRVPATLPRCDGGVWRRASLGARDSKAWPRCAAHPASLRQAVREAAKERRNRCRGDLRGSTAPQHALCCGEDRGPTGERPALPSSGRVTYWYASERRS